jgi:hypothetical protein
MGDVLVCHEKQSHSVNKSTDKFKQNGVQLPAPPHTCFGAETASEMIAVKEEDSTSPAVTVE